MRLASHNARVSVHHCAEINRNVKTACKLVRLHTEKLSSSGRFDVTKCSAPMSTTHTTRFGNWTHSKPNHHRVSRLHRSVPLAAVEATASRCDQADCDSGVRGYPNLSLRRLTTGAPPCQPPIFPYDAIAIWRLNRSTDRRHRYWSLTCPWHCRHGRRRCHLVCASSWLFFVHWAVEASTSWSLESTPAGPHDPLRHRRRQCWGYLWQKANDRSYLNDHIWEIVHRA